MYVVLLTLETNHNKVVEPFWGDLDYRSLLALVLLSVSIDNRDGRIRPTQWYYGTTTKMTPISNAAAEPWEAVQSR
jgi:hypothetical protein